MRQLVCLSGGVDSAVVLAMNAGADAIGFEYGQPHLIELDFAGKLCERLGVKFTRLALPSMPLINDVAFAARNAVFASWACAYAQAHGYDWIGFGCNKSDWHRFPDCRPAFWEKMRAAFLTTYQIRLATPLLHWTKAEVIEHSHSLNLQLDELWSCYSPVHSPEQGGCLPCGECLACQTREGAIK